MFRFTPASEKVAAVLNQRDDSPEVHILTLGRFLGDSQSNTGPTHTVGNVANVPAATAAPCGKSDSWMGRAVQVWGTPRGITVLLLLFLIGCFLSSALFGPTPLSDAANPEVRVKENIQSALGTSNREGIQRIDHIDIENGPRKEIFVQFAINDCLSDRSIKRCAKSDISSILKAVTQSNIEYSAVKMCGTFSMQDKFGNEEEDAVVNATYQRSTIKKINWNNLSTNNIYAIADDVQLHPAFRE